MTEEHIFWDPFPDAQPAPETRSASPPNTHWREWERRTDVMSLAILGWLSQYIGWGVSLILHATIALALGFIILHPAFRENPFSLETRLDTVDKGLDLGGTGSLTDPQMGGAPLEMPLLTGQPEAGEPGPLDPQPVTLSKSSTALVSGNVSSLGGTGTGIGRMDGSGTGGGEVEFFGSRGLGNSVVFVVDMSGSMQTDKRFVIAQRELIQSINKLQKQQRFYVIFYNMRELPIFSPRPPTRMIAATSALKMQAKNWINTVRPGGGTEPQAALEQALKLRPDMIYFLTDGEIPGETREMLNQANKNKVTIHTIAFQSEAGQEILKLISQDHHGTFRFVP
ncbi:MAG: VWA domain-containing protein [Planctomycetales bacterium]